MGFQIRMGKIGTFKKKRNAVYTTCCPPIYIFGMVLAWKTHLVAPFPKPGLDILDYSREGKSLQLNKYSMLKIYPNLYVYR